MVDVMRSWGILVRNVLLVVVGLDRIGDGTLLLDARESLANALDDGVAFQHNGSGIRLSSVGED